MGSPSKLEIIRQAFMKFGNTCTIDQVVEYAMEKYKRQMQFDRSYVSKQLGLLRKQTNTTLHTECPTVEQPKVNETPPKPQDDHRWAVSVSTVKLPPVTGNLHEMMGALMSLRKSITALQEEERDLIVKIQLEHMHLAQLIVNNGIAIGVPEKSPPGPQTIEEAVEDLSIRFVEALASKTETNDTDLGEAGA